MKGVRDASLQSKLCYFCVCMRCIRLCCYFCWRCVLVCYWLLIKCLTAIGWRRSLKLVRLGRNFDSRCNTFLIYTFLLSLPVIKAGVTRKSGWQLKSYDQCGIHTCTQYVYKHDKIYSWLFTWPTKNHSTQRPKQQTDDQDNMLLVSLWRLKALVCCSHLWLNYSNQWVENSYIR